MVKTLFLDLTMVPKTGSTDSLRATQSRQIHMAAQSRPAQEKELDEHLSSGWRIVSNGSIASETIDHWVIHKVFFVLYKDNQNE